jgi:hypothetical protein
VFVQEPGASAIANVNGESNYVRVPVLALARAAPAELATKAQEAR